MTKMNIIGYSVQYAKLLIDKTKGFSHMHYCSWDYCMKFTAVTLMNKNINETSTSGECFTKTKIDFKLDLNMAGRSCH